MELPSRRISQDDYVRDAVRKYLAEDHSPKELLKEQCKRMGNFVKSDEGEIEWK